ncbi:MAG: alpha/beta fold hydrolase [Gemmatimonadales bacterium]|nr:alpha/beta fold hydrolase [Gemmatimonadales bacterium]
MASATLGSGEPVLFLQGLGLAGSAWLPQVRALAQHYTCAWYDNRGIANTPAPDGRVTIASLVRDAIELLDALGWQRVHLIGQSMGGVIAQELALRDPARVRSLALLCTFRRGRDVMIPRLGWWPHGLRALIGSPEARARALTRLLASQQEIARDGIDSIATRLAEEFGRPVGQRPDVAVAQFRALATHAGNTELSALHRLPSLVISGADDPLAPSSGGRRLATAIAARRFVELPHASHALPILRHEAVNALLLEHLSTP